MYKSSPNDENCKSCDLFSISGKTRAASARSSFIDFFSEEGICCSLADHNDNDELAHPGNLDQLHSHAIYNTNWIGNVFEIPEK